MMEAMKQYFPAEQHRESGYGILDGYKKQLDSEMASYLKGNTVQEWISNFIKGVDFDLKNLVEIAASLV